MPVCVSGLNLHIHLISNPDYFFHSFSSATLLQVRQMFCFSDRFHRFIWPWYAWWRSVLRRALQRMHARHLPEICWTRWLPGLPFVLCCILAAGHICKLQFSMIHYVVPFFACHRIVHLLVIYCALKSKDVSVFIS